MKKFVHFLGYSESEGGIQEVFESSNFDLGEIDLETMERDFDGFDFMLPELTILKYFPVVDNAPYLLKTELPYLPSGTSLSDVVIESVLGPQLQVNDLLWIENERIKILAVNGTDNYNIQRGSNQSLAPQRLYNPSYSELSSTYVTKQRIMPNGLIVKVYDDKGLTLAMGQVSGVNIMPSGGFKVICNNLLSQLENSLIWYEGASIPRLAQEKLNELFCLFDVPDVLSAITIYSEKIEGMTYRAINDLKDSINKICLITNHIISFNKTSGRYEIKYFGRLKSLQNKESVSIFDKININGGSVQVEITPRFFMARVKRGDYSTSVIDYQFQSSYMGSKTLTIEIDNEKINTSSMTDKEILFSAEQRLLFLNSAYEKLIISADKLAPFFVVGNYYQLTDIYKLKMFTDATRNNVFLCLKNSDGEVSLLRQEAFEVAVVAPAIPVSDGDFAFDQSGHIQYGWSLGDFLDVGYSDEGYLYNRYTDEALFYVGDTVKLVARDGTVIEREIATMTSTGVTFTTAVSGIYYMTVCEGYNLTAKNNVYLYENNGKV